MIFQEQNIYIYKFEKFWTNHYQKKQKKKFPWGKSLGYLYGNNSAKNERVPLLIKNIGYFFRGLLEVVYLFGGVYPVFLKKKDIFGGVFQDLKLKRKNWAMCFLYFHLREMKIENLNFIQCWGFKKGPTFRGPPVIGGTVFLLGPRKNFFQL